MTDAFADVQQSFNRCLQRRDFLRRFYTLFLARDERIGEKFAGTDWAMQVHLLRHGISASLIYAGGGDLGEHEVGRLAKSHARGGYDIPAWMYDCWLEALIEAIRETDSRCDQRLEARWRQALAPAIQRMTRGK